MSEQETQFANHGCVCRSLLWFANNRPGSRKMSKTDFIGEFSSHYRDQWITNKMCGGTNIGMALEIAQKLRIATAMHVYRLPTEVRHLIAQGKSNTILLVTERRPPTGGGTKPWELFTHCRVVGSYTALGWVLEEVDDEISTRNPLTILDSELDSWAAYFCVFF
jgi:hypothetical protein